MIVRIVCKQVCKQTINVLYGRPDIMWVSIFVYYVFIYIERKINKIETQNAHEKKFRYFRFLPFSSFDEKR